MTDSRQTLPANIILDASYRILRVVGSGGFGITYEAEDINLGTVVAIKEYYPEEFGDRDASSLRVKPRADRHRKTFEWGRLNFAQEARTLARFEHPSIVRVLRVFEANSTAYMVMRSEQGRNFDDWLESIERLPTQEEMDRIAGPLLDALELMHASNFFHRDIAPDNIIIRADATPVLLDFGAARRAVAEASRSITGIIKAGYSPPEQYATDARLQGPWTDIYAFGATLYRAVTGKVPEELTLRVIDDRMLAAVSVGAGKYRPGFLEAIDACLEVHHADRPQSVAQVRSMLLTLPAREILAPAHVATAPHIELRKMGAMGDARRGQGDPPGALEVYRASLAIAEAEPGNADRQRDLSVPQEEIGDVLRSVSQEKIGDALRGQGDLPGALEAYRASLAVAERLVKADPGNAGWQRDLAVLQEKIGDVLGGQGDLPGALEAYRASLAVAERLAEADSGNAGWQRDLAVSQERIGDALRGQGDLPGALEAYRASLAVAERLAEADPGNAGWQRDLAVLQEKIGDVLGGQGDLPGALEAYRASLAVAERLAEADPGNAGWKRDLSVSQERIGDALRGQGDLPGALEAYRASLVVAERLAETDSGNAGWQRDLTVLQEKIGDVLRAQGNKEEAEKIFEQRRAIIARLVSGDTKPTRTPPTQPGMKAWWAIFLAAVIAVVGWGVFGGLQYTRWQADERGRLDALAKSNADQEAKRQTDAASALKRADEAKARAEAEAKRKAEEERALRARWEADQARRRAEADEARRKIEEQAKQRIPISPPVENRVLTAEEEQRIAPGQEFQECKDCPRMIVVPAGEFTMGSPASEAERSEGETQVHVKIARSLAVGKFAVTFEEWDACVADGGCNRYRPGDQGWGRSKQPVINVNWNDAKTYTAWLSGKTGKTYRLLSEAEREYVARAGTTTPFWWGVSITLKQANFDGARVTVPVDSFEANPWGLYQVHGNVWEWTEDCWNDSNAGNPGDGNARTSGNCSRRVRRGGSFFSHKRDLRAANRFWNDIGIRVDTVGFRLARTLAAKAKHKAEEEAKHEERNATSASGTSGYVAMLASKTSRVDALKAFADLQQKYGDVLGSKTPDVQEANLGDKGVRYRSVVGPPGSREAASEVCKQLKTAGYNDCWVIAY